MNGITVFLASSHFEILDSQKSQTCRMDTEDRKESQSPQRDEKRESSRHSRSRSYSNDRRSRSHGHSSRRERPHYEYDDGRNNKNDGSTLYSNCLNECNFVDILVISRHV